jgi:GT2 family glycosyltransferase
VPTRAQVANSTIEIGAPKVSIVVVAYNKVAYTKQCIESIYKYTNDVDYELIVVDNGSADDTYEYFKSLPKRRIVRLSENQGASVGFNEGFKAAKGKYIAGVCNDFVFTKNWLGNLVKCIESDDSIGYVSPGSSYISNLQQINLKFSNYDEMQIEAEKYNVSDPKKWEERVRLLPNVLFVRREIFDIVGYFDPAFYYGEFADDDLSFRIRRAGYKLVFCGDTFTHHFGHVTGGTDQKENSSLVHSRNLFIKKYNGIDTWADVKYDINLMNLLDYSKGDKKEKVKILGIDVRCGNSLLMAKNKLKQVGFSDIETYAYVQSPIYYEDLKSICSDVQVGKIDNLLRVFKEKSFDYIIFDEAVNTYCNPSEFLEEALLLLNKFGQAAMSIINSQNINRVSCILSNKHIEKDMIKSNFMLDDLLQYADKLNFKTNILNEEHTLTENDKKSINELAKKVSLNNNADLLANKLKVYRYLVSLSR